MFPIIFFLVVFGGYYLWIKLSPNHSDIIKIKFDYVYKKTAFYSKPKVIGAVVIWIFLLLVGIAKSDFGTVVAIMGIVSAVYLFFVIRYLVNCRKLRDFKRRAQKLPGRIVGVRAVTSRTGDLAGDRDAFSREYIQIYLIVEYRNPLTSELEEYVTEQVNANPVQALESLDVTVYYQDREHIRVDDFKRIRVLTDNLAYQLTGRVDGEAEGLLRWEHVRK